MEVGIDEARARETGGEVQVARAGRGGLIDGADDTILDRDGVRPRLRFVRSPDAAVRDVLGPAHRLTRQTARSGLGFCRCMETGAKEMNACSQSYVHLCCRCRC